MWQSFCTFLTLHVCLSWVYCRFLYLRRVVAPRCRLPSSTYLASRCLPSILRPVVVPYGCVSARGLPRIRPSSSVRDRGFHFLLHPKTASSLSIEGCRRSDQAALDFRWRVGAGWKETRMRTSTHLAPSWRVMRVEVYGHRRENCHFGPCCRCVCPRTVIVDVRADTQWHGFTSNYLMRTSACMQAECDLTLRFGEYGFDEVTMSHPFGLAMLRSSFYQHGSMLHAAPRPSVWYLCALEGQAAGSGSEGCALPKPPFTSRTPLASPRRRRKRPRRTLSGR